MNYENPVSNHAWVEFSELILGLPTNSIDGLGTPLQDHNIPPVHPSPGSSLAQLASNTVSQDKHVLMMLTHYELLSGFQGWG